MVGCSRDPVPVKSPTITESETTDCAEFLDGVPDEVAGQKARLVEPAGVLGAAWGDPPIVLTCGVGLPTDFDRFAECVEANGVGWFVPTSEEEDQSSDVTITAAGYRPIVKVKVPAEYRPEGVAAVMTELAAPVEEHLELVDECF